MTAVVCLLTATSRYGPGLAPDSVSYLSAADSLRAGEGLLGVTGAPLTEFPPLLPVALALLRGAGLPLHVAALAINLLGIVAVLAVTVTVVARLSGSRVAAAAAGLFVAACAPHLDAFSWLLTEAPFIGLLALFVGVFARVGHEAGHVGVALLGGIAATLPMTRYVGIVLLPAVALTMILLSRERLARRLSRAALFVSVAAAPMALYLMRNAAIDGELTGERRPASASAVSVARGFVASVIDWLVPWNWLERLQVYSDAHWALALWFGAALLALAAGCLLLRRLWRVLPVEDRAIVALLALWVVGYTAFVCLAALTIAFNPIGPRFLAPLVFPVAILAAAALAEPTGRLARDPGRRILWVASLVAIVALSALQAGRAAVLVFDKRADGAGGFATRRWQESPLMAYVAANPPPAATLTNAPDALYLATGRRYSWLPRADRPAQIAAVRDAAARGEAVHVVWFEAVDWRPYLVTRRDVTAWPLTIAHRADDGIVVGQPPSSR